MIATEAAQDKHPLCPRCGARLRRQRRRIRHRLVSMVYPVRLYACSEECKWTGLLPSATRMRRRKRYVKLVLLFLVLVVAAGWAMRRYGAGLPWGRHAPPGDGIEEDGTAAAE